jgi:hypothetical protein
VDIMSDSPSMGAQIAGLVVEVRHLAMAIERVSADVRELRTDVDGLKTLAAQGRGAWITVASVGALAATVASVAAWMFEHLAGGAV